MDNKAERKIEEKAVRARLKLEEWNVEAPKKLIEDDSKDTAGVQSIPNKETESKTES